MTLNTNGNTLYMTPEEAERIRQAVRNRLRRCMELKGQPRAANANRNLVATASFLADIPGCNTHDEDSDDAPVPAYVMGTVWPPCSIPLDRLKPIGLNELCFETRHAGRILNVRRVSPVVKGKVIDWAAVEDPSTGDAERLEVVLHTTGPTGQRVLEMGERFRIKEPLLTVTEDGGVAIRVLHPSDLVVLLKAASNCEADGNMTAAQHKDAGNAALKAGNLWQARTAYAQGLQSLDQTKEKDLYCDLNRNSAHVNLSLSHNDDALSNALAAVTHELDTRRKDLDAKAYFRAACAVYNLRDNAKAKHYYQKQRELAPNDRGAAAGIQKCCARLREAETGAYDWQMLRAGLAKSRPRVDVADLSRDTVVQHSPGKGNGLFAARDFAPGDLILVEKAFCVVWAHEREKSWTAMVYDVRDERIRAFPAGLSKAVVSKLVANPSTGKEIESMFSDHEILNKGHHGKRGVAVDALRVHDIVARNAFGAGDQFGGETARRASTGLWVHAAKSNHSCVPNMEKQFLGDIMIVRAKVAIAAGEEINNCYDNNTDWEMRKANLERTWGFKCACDLCRAEEADGEEVRRQRRDLEVQARGLIEREDAGAAKKLVIAKAERLLKSIGSTYDERRYQGLPKNALEDLWEWIRVAKKGRP